MFGLTQYNGNSALVATTGFMLTPLASALNKIGYTASRDEEMPSILPAQPSSEWSEWLTSGYVGDFLGWAEKQLAEVGRDLFPEFSIPERQRRMEMSKEELKQLMTESLLADEELDAKIREVLEIYLRQGIALMNRDALEHEVWKEELLSLEAFSEMIGNENTADILTRWIEQLKLVIKKKKTEESTEEALPFNVQVDSRSMLDIRPKQETMDVDLTTLNSTKEGFTINIAKERNELGWSVSGAGDVNGDGFADVIISAPLSWPDGINSGASYVLFGNNTVDLAGGMIDLAMLSSSKAGFSIKGIIQSYSGKSVSGAGDVNGDGFADVIIGAPGSSSQGVIFGPGKSYVIFGNNSTDLAGSEIDLAKLSSTKMGFTIKGAAPDYSGASVSGAGDVNGDGFADVIIGAPAASRSGVYIVFGGNSATLAGSLVDLATLNSTKAGFTLKNNADPSYLDNKFVSGAGDVNGDGFADVIIGATWARGYESGVSYIVFGGNSSVLAGSVIDLTTLNSTKAGFTIRGMNTYYFSGFGMSVSGAGDVNADGFADVIIGASYATGDAYRSGISYVIFGSNSTDLAGSEIDLSTLNSTKAGFIINGVKAYDYSGIVSGAGDVNGDGFSDVIIGLSCSKDCSRSKVNYVVFGSNSTELAGSVIHLAKLNSSTGFNINGAEAYDYHGTSVSGAGDVNGDGLADVIIGASNDYGDTSDSGVGYVVFGSSTVASTPVPLLTPVPTPTPTTFPTSVPTPTPTTLPTSVPTPTPTTFPTSVPTPTPTTLSTPVPTPTPTPLPTSAPTPTPAPSHLERNLIFTGVIASAMFATGLLFFHRKKINDYLRIDVNETSLMDGNELMSMESDEERGSIERSSDRLSVN